MKHRNKLISRDYSEPVLGKDETLIVKVGDVRIGGDEPIIMAGPCAVESKEQVFRIAKEVRAAGARILRGGIYKPRARCILFRGWVHAVKPKLEKHSNGSTPPT